MQRELGRAFKAGELAGAANLTRLENGRWVAYVYRIKEPSRPLVPRSVLIGGAVVLVLGAAGAFGWWAVSATVAAVSVVSVPAIVGLAVVVLGARMALRSASGCTTTVTVRHHH